MSLALYRKYRSKSLDEIVGQKHITDILVRAVERGKVSHAYLFTGPRGVGKTSIARILAHQINNLPYSDESSHLDIIEIDAASNNGIDDVRDLREKARLAPSSASKKIYIIDEVHMLSKPAFNALLKTLEEPPEHVVFILATTDLDKLPATIISRTQRFNFKAINTSDAVAHLKSIAKKENIKISDEALEMIAERGEGSFRDSISLLDQLSSLADDKSGITAELIEASLGLAAFSALDKIVHDIENHNFESIIKTLDQLYSEGVDSNILAKQLLTYVSKKIATNPSLLPIIDGLLEVSKSNYPDLKLISILGQASHAGHPPTKSVALSSPTKEISASVEKLKEIKKQEDKQKKDKTKMQTTEQTINFEELLAHTKKNYIAVYSVLSKCAYEVEDGILNLYCNNSFYKKKLDDPKYAPLLHKSLQELGSGDLEIHTIPTGRPIKDSKMIAIAVIMGGGEEVKIDVHGNERSTSWQGSAA